MAKKTDSAKKSAAKAGPVKPAPVKKPAAVAKKAPVAPAAKVPTSEEIALEAYFISEKRRVTGTPGEPHQDWLEAERRLKAKAKKSSAKGAAKKSA